MQYFWENKDEIKKKRADKKKEKYNKEADERKKKKEYEKQKYDIPEEREKKKESQKEYEKQKYDIPEEREKKKESQKEYEKQKYHQDEKFKERKKELRRLFYHSNKIQKLVQNNLDNHNSGMEYICLSCTRLRSREQVTIWKQGNENVDKKLLILPCTESFNGKSYICTTCRPALYKGFPKINIRKLDDMSLIGNIPYSLPKLNLMEEYLIKLTIPFIRVAHIPRSPNLKLLGGSVCIQSDLSHTMERLNFSPETIIPVSFKRKLQYEGHYIEQVIDKNKVFEWLLYLKKNNHLYYNVNINFLQLQSQLDDLEDTLLTEMLNYDEKRMAKDSIEGKDLHLLEEKHVNKQEPDEDEHADLQIPHEINIESDSELEDDAADAIHEVLDEIDINENDTFLYPVCEIDLEENTIPNKIAKLIVYGEKAVQKEGEKVIQDDLYVQDEFAPELENYLFKNIDEDEDEYLDENVIKEMEGSFHCKDVENVEQYSTGSKIETKKMRKKPKKNVGKTNKKERATVVAPGEGQKFDNEFRFQEEKCFPNLFPMGKGGYASTYMDLGLGFSNYCKLRLTSGLCLKNEELTKQIVDIEEESRIDYGRFRGNHHYMMFLLLILDAINMRRAQTTAFRKVMRLQKYNTNTIKNEDKEFLERRNIGYRTFKSIRGTAPYMELQKSRLFAFLRQIGSPTIFTTITSAEYDWTDLMINIIRGIPDVREVKEIVQKMKASKNIDYILELENIEDIRNHAAEIVINMEGPEMSKLVNDHLVHSISDFDQRIKYLFKLFKLPGIYHL